MFDGSVNKIGRKSEYQNGKIENFLKEVIFELNEKKEPGMQILAEQAL